MAKLRRKNMVRHNFREAVFERDGHTCVFCDITEDLDAHHIVDRNNLPNGGYVLENGITLCPEHHKDAELFHMTAGKRYTNGMHPHDLYDLISSSHELAIRKSKELIPQRISP